MTYNSLVVFFFFFFQAEDGIRDAQESRGLGDVYKRQMVYAVYCLWPYLKKAVPYPHLILLAMSLAGCTMSVYLLYVLKFILKDFCIVCTTFHVINFSMMGFVLKEFAAHKTSCKPKTN
eukprot:TRINITY_DN946_c0_g1_i2.p1 TRINITY_DN946_c0_g1~~TRINITY_DN946_c0_g1_i2.p1  ORF type:complete len:119 (-),score=46.99 TRINITY_DN946_c0_g1_i2:335-691(-)